MKTISITIPLLIYVFALASCSGCGSGWSKLKVEKAQVDELERQTVVLSRIADEMEKMNETLAKPDSPVGD